MPLRSFLLLACILLSVSACERDGEKTPGTPEGTTGAPEATTPARPTGTPQSASQTPSVATPQPGVSATSGPNGRQDGLSFHFGRGVDSFDRSLIVRAVEVTRQLLQDESGVQPPAAVFAYETPVELALAFADDALAQHWRADGMADRLSRTIAEASYRGIVINTGTPAWQEMDATERLRVVAHEFVHVIQLEHTGEDVASETFLNPNVTAPAAGPFWLLEGSAEVVSWLVVQELNLGSYTDALLAYAGESGRVAPELAGLEAYFGFAQGGRQALGASVVATHYLLRSRSLEGLFAFWTEIGRGARWQTAFTRHFGVPPEFFYSDFDNYYETAWPRFTN